MYLSGTIVFSGRDWLLPVAVVVILGLLIAAWSYRGAPGNNNVRWWGWLLKGLGFFALGLCLLEPLWSTERPRPGANYFLLLADNSQGMQVRDRDQPKTRAELLRDWVANDRDPWQVELDKNYQLRRYFFDSRLHATKDFSELNFEGRTTGLGAALNNLKERFQGRPLAGILLFTDGNATDLTAENFDFAGLPPVYPVLAGEGEPPKDLAIEKVSVTQSEFEDAPVTIQAEINALGYKGTPVVARLYDLQGVLKEEQTRTPGNDDDPLLFRFSLRPEQRGVLFYQVRVQAKEPKTEQGVTEEAVLANNSRMIVVDRGQGPYRVLYVSGRPNWEYKFLQRALREDTEIDLVGLIRIAKREPKFEFRGRTGESSNPLFRGFDRKDEETERYDQPVLVRLNTKDAFELQGGFPKTPEDLYRYHALILDDLESAFFTHDQMTLIQKFVSDRGGGFLMLGGQDSFQQGKYEKTPIAEMLPLYLEKMPDATTAAAWRFNLSREGWLQPWARLRDNETDERARLESMPLFQVNNQLRNLKPGASAIATVTSPDGKTYPALVVQRFGYGRTAAFTLGDFWRWGLHAGQKDLAIGWRQLARWLVTDVPQRIEMLTEHQPADDSILLKVRARDEKFQPLDNGAVQIAINFLPAPPGATNASANTLRLTAEPAAQPGSYQAGFYPTETGAYLAQALVLDPEGKELGRAQAGWTADPGAEEFASLKPNRGLLELIARKTGGEMVDHDRLAAFAKSLPKRRAPVMEPWTWPLWNQSGVFLFAVFCFAAEWGLRRWKGLP